MKLPYDFLNTVTQPDPPQNDPEVPTTAKPRIKTQIHRRQKAKAVPPMQDEWDAQSDTPPDLRTPSSKMKKSLPDNLPDPNSSTPIKK